MSIEYEGPWPDTTTTPYSTPPIYPRLSALHNLIDWAKRAVDNNDRITAKAVLTNAEHVVLAMMGQSK